MNKINNSQRVRRIVMKPTAITKCVIGGDWYRNNLTIIFCASESYPDYMQVNEWVMKNIDGKELNIEDVAYMIYNMLEREFKPISLRVIDVVKGCKTHFDVVVEI